MGHGLFQSGVGATGMTQTWYIPAIGAAVLAGIPIYVRLARGRVFATWGFIILVVSLPGLLAAVREQHQLQP